ncbi:Smr/MutS family protein [Sneathiella litorea]|uniref:Smr domain-containing protein n=1 Tax=Sneathiella litorea TaxID=2606216 RepID=A0A6L8W3Y0_9PROT|nr:Smr/MutS family protein [Sneathiella litorea]MZR29771.1 smr domain-containing protein [Sneathiella litorea]
MARKTNRPKGLSKADRDLWDHVARSVDPIDSNRFVGDKIDTTMVPPSEKEANTSTFMVSKPSKTPPDTPAQPRRTLDPEALKKALESWPNANMARNGPKVEPSLRQNVPGLDKRSAERLRKGRMEIDARLDLHGLTRADAHRRLRSFITTAQAQGKRCVLVITGKGSSKHKTDDAPFMRNEKAGVLREAVPKWLMAPDLRQLVIDIRNAQPKHGGSGALYVLLRRNRS